MLLKIIAQSEEDFRRGRWLTQGMIGLQQHERWAGQFLRLPDV